MGNFWIVNWLAWAATTVSTFDYSDALDKSLLFVEAQRFGKLPINQLIKWCGYFELDDGYSQGVNLAGGYYNAEDHVKFGLPMAYTVTMLSWAAIDFRKEMISSFANTFRGSYDDAIPSAAKFYTSSGYSVSS
ncbi:glycoside hydrolase 9C1 [Olea europaea subsp. europaea]|uniref:cellulase n=1 Tax=Olea europaea subsp. europaea TaxID=158383 RepID=A0A8S0T3I4_OLEEU|nr:glycoside hydrolase 9C1 [Olea europaea subsp. europaea]